MSVWALISHLHIYQMSKLEQDAALQSHFLSLIHDFWKLTSFHHSGWLIIWLAADAVYTSGKHSACFPLFGTGKNWSKLTLCFAVCFLRFSQMWLFKEQLALNVPWTPRCAAVPLASWLRLNVSAQIISVGLHKHSQQHSDASWRHSDHRKAAQRWEKLANRWLMELAVTVGQEVL